MAFDFVCPYTKMQLNTKCSAKSCGFFTTAIPSNCIWEHIANRSDNLSSGELAHITGVSKRIITKILKEAKVKVVTAILKDPITSRSVLGSNLLHYCQECGRAYNLFRKVDGKYICKGKHLPQHKKELYAEAFAAFPLPLAYVLYALPKIFSDLSGIKSCLKLKSNIDVRKLYYDVLGIPMGDLVPRAKLVGPKYNKRKRRLKQ